LRPGRWKEGSTEEKKGTGMLKEQVFIKKVLRESRVMGVIFEKGR